MDAQSSSYPRKVKTAHGGFTLVELLVVIVIISLLAGLVLAVSGPVLRGVRGAVVSTEIQQLSMTLATYKNDCGDYPPDCFSVDLENDAAAQNRILRHLRKRFPRYRPANWDALRLDAYNASCGAAEINPDNIDANKGLDLNTLNPSWSLLFFLGGVPDYTTGAGGELMGFSQNPSNPFARGGSRIHLYEFDQTRVVKLPVPNTNDEQVYKYVPKHIKNPANSAQGVPYVYFRARSGGYGPQTLYDLRNNVGVIPHYPLTPNIDIGFCVPYSRTTANTTVLSDTSTYPDTNKVDWYKGKDFQIIAAGMDGQFGTTGAGAPSDPPIGAMIDAYRYFNTNDNNLVSTEDDNLSNFTPGKLEDGVQ